MTWCNALNEQKKQKEERGRKTCMYLKRKKNNKDERKNRFAYPNIKIRKKKDERNHEKKSQRREKDLRTNL